MSLLFKLPRPPRGLECALLILIMWIALFLRAYQLPGLPYGPYYDEAANVVLASEIARAHYWPVFIEPYTGKEVLFFYLAAGLMRLVGSSLFALRLTSALVGVLNVLAAYKLTRALFADETRLEGRWLALLAAGLVAVSFWPVVVSRYGLRANTLPLAQSALVWALWRGLNPPRPAAQRTVWQLGWMALAGIGCGLTAYTYLASRVVPLVLAVAWGMILLADRARLRLRLAQLAIFGLAAGLVFAPLGWFFYTHPETFSVRLSQLAGTSGVSYTPAGLAHAWLRALEMFTVRGDPWVRFNVPERPVFGGLLGWLFYAGLLTAAIGTLAAGRPRRRVRCALLIAWPALMMIPTVLTVPHEIPHSLRAIGVMPAIYILTALGGTLALSALVGVIDSLARWADTQARPYPGRPGGHTGPPLYSALAAVACLAVLGMEGGTTFHDYFVRWAALPAAYYEQDGDMADMVRFLNEDEQAGKLVYASTIHYRHPTAAALAHDYERIKWVTGNRTLVLPDLAAGQAALLAFPHAARPDSTWVWRYLPPGSHVIEQSAHGLPSYQVYELSATPIVSPQHSLHLTFGGTIELLGYDLPQPAGSDRHVSVVLYWRVLRQADWSDCQFFGELSDAWGVEFAKHNSFTYPAEQWSPGEIVVDWWQIPLSPGSPPGEYVLKVGVWSPSQAKRLAATDSQGRLAGTTARLAHVPLGPPQRTFEPGEVPIAHRLNVRLAELTLLGYVQWPELVRQGDTLFAGLYWQAPGSPVPDRRVRASLEAVQEEAGEPTPVPILLYAGAPVHGTLTTTLWLPGQIVADTAGLQLPLDIPPGRYRLHVQLTDADGRPVSPAQPLGEVRIEATARLFSAPSIANPLNVRLGEQAELLGYAWGACSGQPPRACSLPRGQAVQLTLYWRALGRMDTSYVVFVQLLDASGTLHAQRDNPPVQGTYPTTLWLPGEVVVDTYDIDVPADLPAGRYTLITGWYEAESGARLPAGQADHVILSTIDVE